MTHARLLTATRVMPETVLACDTSQRMFGRPLQAQGCSGGRASYQMQRGHAEALLPALAGIKREVADIWAQIDVLAVTVGPGTFTGVRVGLSAMRGLSLAMGVPVAGFGTLHMMALGSAVPVSRLVAVDARRDMYYTQICSADGKPCEPPTARSFKACLSLGMEDHNPEFTVIGTGAAAICTGNSGFSRFCPALAAGRRAGRPCRRPHIVNWPHGPQPPYVAPTRCDPAGPAKKLGFAPAKDGELRMIDCMHDTTALASLHAACFDRPWSEDLSPNC